GRPPRVRHAHTRHAAALSRAGERAGGGRCAGLHVRRRGRARLGRVRPGSSAAGRIATAVAMLAAAVPVSGQETAAAEYRLPPAIVREIADAPPTPAVLPAPDGRTLLLLGRPGMPDVAELSGPVLGLAGVRIDPATN